jgi:hypothetical protein
VHSALVRVGRGIAPQPGGHRARVRRHPRGSAPLAQQRVGAPALACYLGLVAWSLRSG